MARPENAIAVLDEQLRRYPADRYPVQHATAQYHRGVELTNAGASVEAADALGAAAQLFEQAGLRAEHAKTLNALGAARRLAGELDAAAAAFTRAAESFATEGLETEEGAALFNLGLVRREAGRTLEARDTLARARPLLDARRAPAAARELGTAQLELGELDEAVATLTEARELADRTGDPVELGAAANALGLAQLAAGRASAAIEALRTSAGAHPRSLRPIEFAMAKANLALAYEAEGDTPRARLAARQALAAGDAPEPVRVQAEGVLERLGPGSDDLLRVLTTEAPEQRTALMREEAAIWTGSHAEEWVVAQLQADDPEGLAETLLGVALELPPAGMEALLRSLLEAMRERGPDERAQFRDQVSRAGARFHVPQLTRLEQTFRRISAELGEEPWS